MSATGKYISFRFLSKGPEANKKFAASPTENTNYNTRRFAGKALIVFWLTILFFGSVNAALAENAETLNSAADDQVAMTEPVSQTDFDDAPAPEPESAAGRPIAPEASESEVLEPEESTAEPDEQALNDAAATAESLENDEGHKERAESFEELLDRRDGVEFEHGGRVYVWQNGVPFEKNADGTLSAVEQPENLYEVRADGSRWLSREADGTIFIDVAPKVWATIVFGHNSDEIMDESRPVLDVFGSSLTSEALAEHRLLIVGHTSSDGSLDYNVKLSQRRAQSVANYLIGEHQIDPGRLILHGYGPERPIADNETEEGRAANRRVEFILLSPLAD